MPLSKTKASEIYSFYELNGEDKTIGHYGVKRESLYRYLRIARASIDPCVKVDMDSIKAGDMDEFVKEWKSSGIIPYKVKEHPDEERRVLVIGDLHEPFTREGYLEFCKGVYDKYRCNRVVFTADLIDLHFSSFHDIDPDGHSAAEELRLAKINIAKWYKTFPVAKVTLGNHDNIPIRKAFSAGLSNAWIKPVSEVLETPTWEYADSFIIDNVMYTHGIGRKAANRMQKDLISVVQGHYHSESYITFAVGAYKRLFAMQVGCGVNDKSYAMAYGKHFDKMHINCGVVLENGTLPILEYMKLGNW